MSNLKEETPLFGTNSLFIEEIYERYLIDPNSVDDSWKGFFRDMGDSIDAVTKEISGATWAPRKSAIVGVPDPDAKPVKQQEKRGDFTEEECRKSLSALMLIRAFKVRGCILADLDPLGIEGRKSHPDLDPQTYGFTEEDYDRSIFLGGSMGLERATLRELLDLLRRTYSSKIGVEFMHIPHLEQRDWIASRIEAIQGRPKYSNESKKTILQDMVEVEMFEEYLHIKYPGAKRFSAEGGESVFAAMEQIIETSSKLGIGEIVIGMPHRGRMGVLTKIMKRRYAAMFSEFQGNQAFISADLDATGDVKYHHGASSDREIDGKNMHLSLSANPSHLEAVNPVVVGRVRAKQKLVKDEENRKAVMGLLLHGDAAFAGQGVVPETLALGDLQGYTTGGTINIIVNNQIGFTTSPKNARKSPFPSDIAKGVHAPIFHVNGDDPEAVVFVSQMAVEFRQEFGIDVIIDVFCYRKYGHNEGDEPFFTQPVMYSVIKDHPTPMHVYAKRLISEGVITEEYFQKIQDDFQKFLDKEHKAAQNYGADEADWLGGSWKGFESPEAGIKASVDTGVDVKKLKEIGNALASYPKQFNVNRKLIRQFEAKKDMMKTGKGLDWAMGESLAFATLLSEGFDVRLSGQDCMRGTFSHRHSGLVDQADDSVFYPLNHLGLDQARYEVINSNLSEFAVMGFEYGYTLADPNSLVMWEAQFGDFANGAQIIIDQFIASSEKKWLRFSGLVLLLPHGSEGQGPEHSSCRPERYLQLCAEDNMQIVNCSTPANFFHVLRRQIHRKFRKPLIIMTPKSLLRHKRCVSDLSDFKPGTAFKHVIGETEKIVADDKVRKVILSYGKVYYELLEAREEKKIKDIALVRLEQLYPFPEKHLVEELKKYKNAEVVWCQEEPENLGAWHFLDRRLEAVLAQAKVKAKRPNCVSRKAAATTAPGYMKIHLAQQKAVIDAALS